MRAWSPSRSWLRWTLAAAALTGGAAFACTITNSNHCAFPGGSNPCGAGLVCDRCAVANNGCVAADELTEQSCLHDDSASTSETTTTTTSSTTEMTTTTTSSTEPTTTTLTTTTTTSTTDPITSSETAPDPDLPPGFMCDPEVPANAECFQNNPQMPYCVAMDDCGDCQDLQAKTCADIDPSTPACPASGGLCVECTADNLKACGPSQVCNQYLNDCGACFEHEQCMSGACDLAEGTCFSASALWVDNSEPCPNPDGTEANPFCEIAEAIASKPGQNLVIRVKKGSGPYKAPILVKGSRMAFIGVRENEADPLPLIQDMQSLNTLLTVESNAALFIDGIAIDGSSLVQASTIDCDGSHLWFHRASISKNANPIKADTCNLVLDRTVVHGNSGGSNIIGGTFRVRNSFITGNNGGILGTPFRVNATVEVVYSTFVGNQGSSATGISCVSNNTAITRNSVLLGQPDPIVGCTYKDEVKDKEGTYVGLPNEINALFQGAVGGTYRPQPAAAAISDLAVWHSGDPYTDYFGELRPNAEGEMDFAGAAYP